MIRVWNMGFWQSKDESPATDKPIVKKELVSSLEIVNHFTPLGTIPKPNYSSVLVSSYDLYALISVNQPIKTDFPKASCTSQYVKKQSFQNLFFIESNRASITDLFRLATNYFRPRFHWIPEHSEKTVQYYSDILRHENSITIRAIENKINTSKVIYHSVFLNHIISEEMWGPNLASTRMLPKSHVPYSYHDYITAWFKFMLHQNENMTHSWFVNFDKDFSSNLPLWFIRWWTQFGSAPDLPQRRSKLIPMMQNSLLYFIALKDIKFLGS
ncbi:hypothetical protein SO802_002343 [Lithocarpus litseifolius]|uniref:Maturase K n=1 Tax=Lithocarpus litseifolius TaxID=425828 RepID=A0AAW2DYM8_9ROSI